jgi:hypothetical protein
MATKISDAEAILLAKRVARDAADQAEVVRSDYFHRFLALLVWAVGLPTVGAYGRELATHFGTSKDLLMFVAVLAGGLALAGAEIAILRRKVESLARLLQTSRRDA